MTKSLWNPILCSIQMYGILKGKALKQWVWEAAPPNVPLATHSQPLESREMFQTNARDS